MKTLTYFDNIFTFTFIIGQFTVILNTTIGKLHSSERKIWYVMLYSDRNNTCDNYVLLSIKYSFVFDF